MTSASKISAIRRINCSWRSMSGCAFGHFSAEHRAERRRYVLRHIREVERVAEHGLHTGYRLGGDSARRYTLEVVKIGGDVKHEAMQGDPPRRDRDANP